jgi:hypothetical protein
MARGIIDRAAKSGRWGRGKKASPNVVAGAVASVAQRKAFSGATLPGMDILLAVLDKKTRDSLDASEFAIPETRSYPIPDLIHARVALSLVKMHGTPEQQAKVRAAIAKKYPDLKLSNPARDLLFAEAAERGMIDLGRDGAKWRHGWIPLNAIAAAIKAKKWHGHGGSKGNLPSGKSRISIGANAAHAMAPKGKARATAAQRARAEAARRPGFDKGAKYRERMAGRTGEGSAARKQMLRDSGVLTDTTSVAQVKAHADAAEKKGNLSGVPAGTKAAVMRELASRRSDAELHRMHRQGGTAESRMAGEELRKRYGPAMTNRQINGETRVREEGKSGIPSRSEQEAAVKAGLASRAERTGSPSKYANTDTSSLEGALGTIKDPVAHKEIKAEQAKRAAEDAAKGKVTLKGNESYNLTTGKRVETTSTPKAEISIEHSGDGTLVHGTKQGDTETNAALKAQGFRWSRNLGAWYQPRNISEPVRAQRAKALHSKLGGEGGKSSLTVGDLAKSGTADEQAQARVDSANRSAERNSAKAEALAKVSDERYKRAHDIGSHIPFGQPILVGHHSEGRHRSDLAKIDTNMRKSMAAQAASEEAARRAESATARANMQTDPKAAARRLERNQAELRKVQRTLHGTGKEMYGTDKPATGEHADRLRAMEKDLQAKIEHDQGITGTPEYGKHNVKPGDVIRVRGSVHVVHSTGPKNVKVHTSVGPLPYPYHQITAHGPLEKVSTEALERMVANNNAADRLPAATVARIQAILAERKK